MFLGRWQWKNTDIYLICFHLIVSHKNRWTIFTKINVLLKIGDLKSEKRKYWLYTKIYLQLWAHFGNNSLIIYQSENVSKERCREKLNTCLISKTLPRNLVVLEITRQRIRSWNLSGSKAINPAQIWLQASNWELIVQKDWTVSNHSVSSSSAPRRNTTRLRSKL